MTYKQVLVGFVLIVLTSVILMLLQLPMPPISADKVEFASLEAAGTAASVGISYIFHRTGHHQLERWLSIGHIGITGFGVAWNYSLKSNHR